MLGDMVECDHGQLLAMLKRAFDRSSDGIMITNADFDNGGPFIVYVNSAYQAMTGYTLDEMVGKTPRILQGPRTDSELLACLGRALRAGENFHGETVNYKKDGTAYWVEWEITPVTDGPGQVRYFLSMQRETTKRRQATDALDRTFEAYKRSNEKLKRFARIAAHDLQDPLMAVRGYIELVQSLEGKSQERVADYLASALEGVERMSEKIKDLMETSEALDKRVEPVDLKGPVEEALQDVDGLRRSLGARISADCFHSVMANRTELREVFQNLLSNALKYRNPDRRPLVAVTSSQLTEKLVRIEVVDNGKGISDNRISTIFRDGVKGRDGGHGAGLAFVRAALEEMGGTVAVRSREGVGTIFIITLSAA